MTSIAVAILSEYHELFGKQLPDQGAIDHQTLEEQKRQLNFELNSSGKYFAFKEQLKVKRPFVLFTSLLVLSWQFLSEELSGGNLGSCVTPESLPATPGCHSGHVGEQVFPLNGPDTKLLSLHTRRTFSVNGEKLQSWSHPFAPCL